MRLPPQPPVAAPPGQGYGDGSYDREQCEALLADLHDTSGGPGEVSHRNRVPLVITRVDPS